MMTSIHGRSPEPSPCGYDVSGLAAAIASLRRATRSDALAHVGVRNPPPLAGWSSLDAARRSSGFAAGNARAALRASSLFISVSKSSDARDLTAGL